MLAAYIPETIHAAILDKLEAVVASIVPGDHDLRFRLVEALGEAGIWPSYVGEDEEAPARVMEVA